MAFWRVAVMAAGIGLLAVSQPAVVWAQQGTPAEAAPREAVPVKIAVIDVGYIQRHARAVKSIREQLDKYRTAFGSEAQNEDEELRKANEELARQRAILAPEVFAEERRKFEQKVAQFQGKVQNRGRALDQVLGEAMQVVENELEAVVTDLSNEFGLSLILRKDVVILRAPALDATAEALKRLDARLSTVKVSDPSKLPATPGK